MPLSGNDQAAMFKQAGLFLRASGYDHYEVSNYARNHSCRSRHNSTYWAGTPYIGLGPSAHSFDGTHRSWNHACLDEYLSDVQAGRRPVDETETLTREQQMIEMIMLQLRRSDGLDMGEFETRFDLSFETVFSRQMAQVTGSDLATTDQRKLVLNIDGWVRLNSIVSVFVDRIYEYTQEG
jgi:oxygen-independent coproporphyrinogen-3 oxidase